MSFPKVQPIKLKEYTSKQSKYSQCAKLPMRSIVLGPSGSGKTILLQNMILDIYEGCFDKIYIFFTECQFRSYLAPGERIYKREDENKR
jgi:predicted AAA+ superfamily ATPase